MNTPDDTPQGANQPTDNPHNDATPDGAADFTAFFPAMMAATEFAAALRRLPAQPLLYAVVEHAVKAAAAPFTEPDTAPADDRPDQATADTPHPHSHPHSQHTHPEPGHCRCGGTGKPAHSAAAANTDRDTSGPDVDSVKNNLAGAVRAQHRTTRDMMALIVAVEAGRKHTVVGATVTPEGTVAVVCRCGQQLAPARHTAHYNARIAAATGHLAGAGEPCHDGTFPLDDGPTRRHGPHPHPHRHPGM